MAFKNKIIKSVMITPKAEYLKKLADFVSRKKSNDVSRTASAKRAEQRKKWLEENGPGKKVKRKHVKNNAHLNEHNPNDWTY